MASTLMLGLTTTASAADPFTCDPGTDFELDANGFVTSFPYARCTGQGTFASIEIYHGMTLDNKPVDGFGNKQKYTRKKAGVYVGKAISARNIDGTNTFCALVTVYWAHALDKVAHSKEARNCVNY
ncbi:MAG: hypothetical protein ACT4RN_21770 [Pseudonocardia sp.]